MYGNMSLYYSSRWLVQLGGAVLISPQFSVAWGKESKTYRQFVEISGQWL